MHMHKSPISEKPEPKLKVVDIFAGCGGLSKGFSQAGHNIVAAIDSWRPAILCYRANFPNHAAIELDLSDFSTAANAIRYFDPDIIIGGPPCQDFSQAGTRIESERAALTLIFAKLVAEIKPTYFLMENVARAQKSTTYAKARDIFKKANYGLTESVLDASLYGVPQRRKRLIVIGGRNAADGEFSPFIQAREGLIPSTVRAVYPDFGVEYYYRHPRSYSRRAVFSIDEPSPTIRGVNRPRPQSYASHKNDASSDKNIRALTFPERALIQTFPSDYVWPSQNAADLEQMIGNAVPVKLAKTLGDIILAHANGLREDSCFPPFRQWLHESKGLSSESLKDIVSHLRRGSKILPLADGDTANKNYLDTLKKKDAFCNMSKASQQQVSRAVKLYEEFIKMQSDSQTSL